MTKTKKKEIERESSGFNISPGSASILLIFITLCLVAFSILAYVSARSDQKLNDKVLDRTNEYYRACNEAYEMIAAIDSELANAYITSSGSDDYFEKTGSSRDFSIAINDKQSLYVVLEITYPGDASENAESADTFYTITKWYVKNNSDGSGSITIID